MALVDHETGAPFSLLNFNDEGGELAAMHDLLERSDIGGKVITLDALHTTRHTAKLITQRADYVFVVKGNAPETFAILDSINWQKDATGHFTEPFDKAHGRLEQRSISVLVPLDGLINYPGVRQVARITRYREPWKKGSGDAGKEGSGDAGKEGSGDAGKEGPGDAGKEGSGDAGKEGSGDAGKEGPGDAGKEGSGDAGKEGSGDAGKEGSGDAGKKGSGDAGKEGPGDAGKEGPGDAGKKGSGDAGKEGPGDAGKEGPGDAGKKGSGDAGKQEEKDYTETDYIITSLDTGATSPEELLRLNRRHWAVENLNHRQRDCVFGEDACLTRTDNGPANRASLNNIALAVIFANRRETESLAETRRRLQLDRREAINALTRP